MNWLSFLLILACPLAMGFMMMRGGHQHGGSCHSADKDAASGDERDTRIAQLEREVAGLRESDRESDHESDHGTERANV